MCRGNRNADFKLWILWTNWCWTRATIHLYCWCVLNAVQRNVHFIWNFKNCVWLLTVEVRYYELQNGWQRCAKYFIEIRKWYAMASSRLENGETIGMGLIWNSKKRNSIWKFNNKSHSILYVNRQLIDIGIYLFLSIIYLFVCHNTINDHHLKVKHTYRYRSGREN